MPRRAGPVSEQYVTCTREQKKPVPYIAANHMNQFRLVNKKDLDIADGRVPYERQNHLSDFSFTLLNSTDSLANETTSRSSSSALGIQLIGQLGQR